MKSYISSVIVVLCSLLQAGCFVPSIHPFCPESSTVEMPQLDGRWHLISMGLEDASGKSAKPWVFEKNKIKTYEGTMASLLTVNYFIIASNTFADLTINSEEVEAKINPWARIHMMPVHSLCKLVVATNDTMQLTPMDGKWLERQFADGMTNLAHVVVNSDNLLTASPAELFSFVTSIATNEEAFPTNATYTFRKAKGFNLLRSP